MSNNPVGKKRDQGAEKPPFQPSSGRMEKAFLRDSYARYWGELCSYLRGKFGAGPPDPEDIAQAVFTRLAEGRSKSQITNIRAFIYAAARNEVSECRRREARRAPYDRDIAEQSAEENLSAFDAERVLIGKEELGMMLNTLKNLPVRHRRLFLLSRVEGLTCAQIAEREGMTEAAVQRQIARTAAQCLMELEAAQGKERGE